MEAPFKYLEQKDVVRVDLDDESENPALSGLHGMAIVKPGKDIMGVSFDELKQAGKGILDIDPEQRRARISEVFKPDPVAARKTSMSM